MEVSSVFYQQKNGRPQGGETKRAVSVSSSRRSVISDCLAFSIIY
jgi:hypothetical protein